MLLLGVGAALAALVASPFVHRQIRRRRNAKALAIKSPNGIAEGRLFTIGGIEQWISIRGENRDNPVLLFVHGGPGSSYEMFTPVMRAWEEHFTVVQWDQRGAGRSGSGEITFELLARDGLEVTEVVRRILGKERVILVGSSLGSLIALQMAKAAPELYDAYVGTDQNTAMDGDISEAIARLRAMKSKKGVATLTALDDDHAKWTAQDWGNVGKWSMMSAPGPNAFKTILGPAMWFSPTLTLRDLKKLMASMEHVQEQLCGEYLHASARRFGPRYELPFFIFQGSQDVLTPAADAAAFFDEVQAPVKEMALIEGAGHFAAFSHPQVFLDLLMRHVRPRILA